MNRTNTSKHHTKHILPPEERRHERRVANMLKHADQVEDWEDEDLPSREFRYRRQHEIE